jgi:hypothetical protein
MQTSYTIGPDESTLGTLEDQRIRLNQPGHRGTPPAGSDAPSRTGTAGVPVSQAPLGSHQSACQGENRGLGCCLECD